MIYFSDLHVRPESEDTTFAVLERLRQMEAETGHAVAGLGDFYHTRYTLPVYLINRVRDVLREFKRLYLLVGNHDSIDVVGRNALEMLGDLPNVRVFSEPEWDPLTGCWLPYRKRPEDLLEWIAANPRPPGYPDVAHLHHGIVGASMNNGMVAGALDGLPADKLPFARVYCGHWHRHQQIAQCVYVGSQWQTRPDEAGQVKGVLVTKPVPEFRTGPEFTFQPMTFGASHHQLTQFTPQELGKLHPGDLVKVPAETAQKTVDALQALGVQVTRSAPEVVRGVARLGDSGTPLRVQAEKYVAAQKIPEGITPAELMAAYDEVASG